MKRAFFAACALLALGAPAVAQEAPPAAESVAMPPTPQPAPAPSRQRPAENTDEGGLWGVSDRAETQARASGQIERDPALNAYVREVACRVAAQYCGDVRVYVMNRPFFNASMAPNGYMEVWSGLLLRADDEAQLAFVLGHETTHYAERHSIEMMRTVRGRATAAMILSVGASAAGAGYAGDLIYLGTLASVFGYSREKETEADMVGFDHAAAAGYDVGAGAGIWNSLIAETRASDNPDVRRRETRGSIFATHPVSTERVQALQARATQRGAGGETFRERYRAAIRPHLDPWLRAELRRRDFGQTMHILDRLAAHGEDLGVVEYYRGEVNRIRRGNGDRDRARTHYLAAIAQPDAPAAAWRELGEMAARDGSNAEAAQLFATYLERAPNAEDRALVEARLAQISGGAQ
jgi:beta-barrel assembly-enhancing protease